MAIPDPWPENQPVPGYPHLERRYGMGYGWRICIKGTRHDLVFVITGIRHQLDLDSEAVAAYVRDYTSEYGLDIYALWEALRYYKENQAEVDDYIANWHAVNEESRAERQGTGLLAGIRTRREEKAAVVWTDKLERGLADVAAGRTRPLEQLRRELEA
jgi:hypothetical protein